MEWVVMSLLPFVENRGGIPVAIMSGIDPLTAWIISSSLSFLGGFVIYILLGRLEPVLRKSPLSPLFNRVVDRVREKGRRYIERFGGFALFFLVAIPFPGSGAYTGALFAYLFKISLKATVTGLLTGVLVSGLFILTASVSLMALI